MIPVKTLSKDLGETLNDEIEDEKNEITNIDEFDYDSMTVAELKELAKEKGIEGYSKLNKAEIIEILK